MNERFVLHDDGAWMYYLGDDIPTVYSGDKVVPDADGQPMTALQQPGWWGTDHEAAAITYRKARTKTIGYRLQDPSAASEKFPAALTLAEWESRRTDEFLWELYTAVTEPQPDEIVTIDGPWIRLDGTPPPDDGRTWLPRLPDALRNRPEYHRLFPGHMPGFHDHIEQLARRHPRKDTVLKDFQGVRGIHVTLRVPFDPPVTEYRPARNLDGSVSRSRKGKNVFATVPRKVVLDAPNRIAGATRAEAAARWDELTAHFQALLDEASVAACSHCQGHGYVLQDAEEVSRG